MAFPSILIVDDEPNQRYVLEQALKHVAGDWQIESVASALEALTLIDQHPPALIITDYHMPEMNGLELIAAVRERQLVSHIILMTAYTALDVQIEAERLGVDHYLIKPVPIATLRQLTASVIESQSSDEPIR
jgi:CheY-like chemotaxis protein